MQPRQLQKMLNKSSSKTKYDFLKYKRILAPFLMAFSEKIHGNYSGKLSRSHVHYVSPGIDDNKEYYCGWPNLEFVRANVIKTGN